MSHIGKLCVSLLSGLASLAMLSAAAAAPPGPVMEKNVTVTVINAADLIRARSSGSQELPQVHDQQMSLTSFGPAPRIDAQTANNGRSLPFWVFQVKNAPRDGANHVGAMVGTSPFSEPQTSRIPTVIVPMIITTHTVAVSFDPKTGILGTTPGDVTQNSGAPQSTCLTPPNNVPSTLVLQSPIFQNAPFNLGGISFGNTQYIDAFQRANFFQALGGDTSRYHVLFDPVRITQPVTLDVPANEGLAIPAQAFGLCGTVQILDFNWFDGFINGTLLPQLASQGVDPRTIPVFFLYNTDLASPVTDLNTCCVLGYHSFAGEPTPSQTYSVAEIDVSGLFPPGDENTEPLSHEMAELVDDPYADNEVPPWGHIGQQGGCQENLEDGDPLSGTIIPTVTMPNGFTYNLQELAFFSWFFGGESLGINGWYSDNGTFRTDAGPQCGADLTQ